jgi:gliding motility-associated-like protein
MVRFLYSIWIRKPFVTAVLFSSPIVSRNWDFGDGGSSPDLNPSHTFSGANTYIVAQNVETASGCLSSFTDTIRVYGTPTPIISGPAEICIGDSLHLTSSTLVPDTALTLEWEVGNFRGSMLRLDLLPADTGRFTVQLKAGNLLGCTADTSSRIRVNPLPVITLPGEIITPVGADLSIPVTYNDPHLIYAWSPSTYLNCTNCAVPTIVAPRFPTTYTVQVTDSHGCESMDSIRLVTVCNNLNYFMPNTFSPNGDGVNDWFYPRGSFINKIQSLRIFNRWGELVFEKKGFAPNNMTEGWNGFYKGKPAGQDVYVYILELICENAQIIAIKGNVTLIR